MIVFDTPFKILWRTFVEQFAANESATSDIQIRRAIIGVVTFLITPGVFLIGKTMSSYELTLLVARHKNMPHLIENYHAQMAVLFVSYSMITTGLLTVFIWDTLVFDKRDAMVLGPLPLSGRTIVGAKLAALATLLIGSAAVVNITSGLPFAFVTGGPEGHILRHLAGHLTGTIGGAVFIFCTLVIVRGLLVLVVSAHVVSAVGSLLQFLFLSAVLVFMMVPTATGQVTPPISWFAALFEEIRGATSQTIPPLARQALIVLPPSIAGAIAIIAGSYWKQMRAALAPSARVVATARVRRKLASLITGRDRVALATSDFVLTTLARSRVQQAPVAIAAALGVAIISVAIVSREGALAELRAPRAAVLWIPIVIGYWIVIGLRASFVVPAELKASWVLRVHSQLPPFESPQGASSASQGAAVSYWSGVRAAMFAFAIGPAQFVNLLVVLPLVGWRVAAMHSVIVTLAVAITAQFASLLVEGVPFTRAYPPGHAKLKTRWQFYLLGMWAIAYMPVRMEQQVLHDSRGFAVLMMTGFVVLGVLEVAGRRRARTWTMPPDSESDDADPEALTFLNLGPDAGHNPQAGLKPCATTNH
ncbi:MAG TPA: hypothetical protein VM115_02025 [Vicinamibacterales bacterium]|nr:hypothetical protein [Vicinamibacterales bacterium]